MAVGRKLWIIHTVEWSAAVPLAYLRRTVYLYQDDLAASAAYELRGEPLSQLRRYDVVAGSAFVAGVAVGSAVGIGIVALARGEIGGAPGISRALSRIGRLVGGGMLAGVGTISAAAALSGLIVYAGLTELEELSTSR